MPVWCSWRPCSAVAARPCVPGLSSASGYGLGRLPTVRSACRGVAGALADQQGPRPATEPMLPVRGSSGKTTRRGGPGCACTLRMSEWPCGFLHHLVEGHVFAGLDGDHRRLAELRLHRPARLRARAAQPTSPEGPRGDAGALLPGVRRVASLAKRRMLAMHQGLISEPHFAGYLNEFVFARPTVGRSRSTSPRPLSPPDQLRGPQPSPQARVESSQTSRAT